MTYKTKNATFVFAFVAMLMVAPLAGQQANGDGTAIVDAACGFNEVNADSFGSLTRGAATVTEKTVVFTPTAGSTGTGTIFVVAHDWFGTGARAQAEFVISNVDLNDELDVHGITYTAISGSEGTNEQFNHDGTDIQVAASLARAINAGDGGATGLIATTSGTAIVAIKSQQGGTVGNSAPFNIALGGTHTGDTTVTGATGGFLDGGGVGSTTKHMEAETTKFFIINDATTSPGTSTGKDYATLKTAMPVEGDAVGIEMISGTTQKDVEISFEISTAYLTSADGIVTLAAVEDGDTVTIDGVVYTGQAGVTSGANFQRGLATNILDADQLVSAINAVGGSRVTASNGGGTLAVVTVQFDTGGEIGNIVGFVSSNPTRLGVTSTTGNFMDGGTEYLLNLPYDGALTQDLELTISCEGV